MDKHRQRGKAAKLDPWFLRSMVIGNQPHQHIHREVGGASMASMLDLLIILELVHNALDFCPLAQQEFVQPRHQAVLHILPQASDKLHIKVVPELVIKAWDM